MSTTTAASSVALSAATGAPASSDPAKLFGFTDQYSDRVADELRKAGDLYQRIYTAVSGAVDTVGNGIIGKDVAGPDNSIYKDIAIYGRGAIGRTVKFLGNVLGFGLGVAGVIIAAAVKISMVILSTLLGGIAGALVGVGATLFGTAEGARAGARAAFGGGTKKAAAPAADAGAAAGTGAAVATPGASTAVPASTVPVTSAEETEAPASSAPVAKKKVAKKEVAKASAATVSVNPLQTAMAMLIAGQAKTDKILNRVIAGQSKTDKILNRVAYAVGAQCVLGTVAGLYFAGALGAVASLAATAGAQLLKRVA